MILNDSVTAVTHVGPEYAKKLVKLGIYSVRDLLTHIPSRYTDLSQESSIAHLTVNETVTVKGTIVVIKNIFTKTGKTFQEATLSDGDYSVKIVWFNQPFLVRSFPTNTLVSLSGKVSLWKGKPALIAPSWEKIQATGETIHTGRIVPVYAETAGITSKWLRATIKRAMDSVKITDYSLETELLDLQTAYHNIHFPISMEDAVNARKRLAFDELLGHQIVSKLEKIKWRKFHKSPVIPLNEKTLEKFVSSLPFTLTNSQQRSIDEILRDLTQKIPMNRLLEGDVGSGKTVVAAASAFMVYAAGFQTIVMAPTQILAEQHAITLKRILEPFGVRVALITGGVKEDIVGRADVVVGTHALLHHPELYKEVGLVVIDEQHRFGVRQRALITELSEKRRITPHILTMTATPIPRTIALTLYGELALSTLDELPSGRIPIKTWVITDQKRESAYQWIEKEIETHKSQVFVVCPLIDESDVATMKEVKAAKAEFEKLTELFPNRRVVLLHGKMKKQEKSKILSDYKDGLYDILVTTPVVEVGIDIPNASIMMIEASERFGLAQLHQLRGRVGRGTLASYCLLMTTASGSSKERLQAMTKTLSGRELAEFDLSLRGPGEIFGTRQSGITELKIASWQDTDLIAKASSTAQMVVENQEKHQDIITFFASQQITAN